MIETVAVEGYRTLRGLVVELGQLTVVTGANGSGKSNFFRALRLLAACGQGRVVGALAAEGGLPSTLWAGPQHGTRPGGLTQGTRRTDAVALRLGLSGPDVGYAIDLGLPQTDQASPFALDPEIKTESVWSGGVLRPATLQAERRRGHVRTRDDAGRWSDATRDLRPSESMIDEFVDDTGAPEMLRVRRDLRGWRFYDQFRTDPHAPARAAQVGTQTPVLADDGADLAAALATIQWMSGDGALERAIDDAFPGSELSITSDAGLFRLALHQPGLLRPLSTAELSDGTLRYLLLLAALGSPRPPELLVLNEPETSLHPDLLPALARLVLASAERTQTILVTHSQILLDSLDHERRTQRWRHTVERVHLVKSLGETGVDGREGPLDGPRWAWAKR